VVGGAGAGAGAGAGGGWWVLVVVEVDVWWWVWCGRCGVDVVAVVVAGCRFQFVWVMRPVT
jgi:hypothetical protein